MASAREHLFDPTMVLALVRAIMDQWTQPLPIRPHQKSAYERYHHGPHHILFDRPFAMAQTEQLLVLRFLELLLVLQWELPLVLLLPAWG